MLPPPTTFWDMLQYHLHIRTTHLPGAGAALTTPHTTPIPIYTLLYLATTCLPPTVRRAPPMLFLLVDSPSGSVLNRLVTWTDIPPHAQHTPAPHLPHTYLCPPRPTLPPAPRTLYLLHCHPHLTHAHPAAAPPPQHALRTARPRSAPHHTFPCLPGLGYRQLAHCLSPTTFTLTVVRHHDHNIVIRCWTFARGRSSGTWLRFPRQAASSLYPDMPILRPQRYARHFAAPCHTRVPPLYHSLLFWTTPSQLPDRH